VDASVNAAELFTPARDDLRARRPAGTDDRIGRRSSREPAGRSGSSWSSLAIAAVRPLEAPRAAAFVAMPPPDALARDDSLTVIAASHDPDVLAAADTMLSFDDAWPLTARGASTLAGSAR
jgi:hypothetical protein